MLRTTTCDQPDIPKLPASVPRREEIQESDEALSAICVSGLGHANPPAGIDVRSGVVRP